MLTYDQIRELIRAVAEHQLERLEIERSGFRLMIAGRSQGPAVVAAARPSPSAEAPSPPPPVAAFITAAPAAPEAEKQHFLTSPIVGTFYSAPNPEADPFVRAGDRVRKGQVVCIVEAMKLMNEIESDIDGVIVSVLPQNAQPVEYGERLFAMLPD